MVKKHNYLCFRNFQFSDIPRPVLGLNCVGGLIALELLHTLSQGAYLVTYGGMSREPVSVPTSALIFKDIKFVGFWMTRWYRQNRGSEEHQEMLNDLMEYMKTEKLKPPLHHLLPLKEYHVALDNTLKKQGFTGVKYFLDMRA